MVNRLSRVKDECERRSGGTHITRPRHAFLISNRGATLTAQQFRRAARAVTPRPGDVTVAAVTRPHLSRHLSRHARGDACRALQHVTCRDLARADQLADPRHDVLG
jgi:hypothetical protein